MVHGKNVRGNVTIDEFTTIHAIAKNILDFFAVPPFKQMNCIYFKKITVIRKTLESLFWSHRDMAVPISNFLSEK